MAEDDSLLPFNSTEPEKALSGAVARIGGVPVPVGTVWNPETCPVSVLPFLAWALSVDDWSTDWSTEVKRAVIAAAVELHRSKGTPWSVKRALISSGYADTVTIEEGGIEEARGGTGHWAEFGVTLNLSLELDTSGVTSADVRRAINIYKPARSHLVYLSFNMPLEEVVEAAEDTGTLNVEIEGREVFARLYHDASFSHDGSRVRLDPIGEGVGMSISHGLVEHIKPAIYHDGSRMHDGSHLHSGLIEEGHELTITLGQIEASDLAEDAGLSVGLAVGEIFARLYHDGSFAHDGSRSRLDIYGEAQGLNVSQGIVEAAAVAESPDLVVELTQSEEVAIFEGMAMELITFQPHDGARLHDGWFRDENKVAI